MEDRRIQQLQEWRQAFKADEVSPEDPPESPPTDAAQDAFNKLLDALPDNLDDLDGNEEPPPKDKPGNSPTK